MNLLSTCLHRLTHRRAHVSPQLARRRAAAARVARLTQPAAVGTGCSCAADSAMADVPDGGADAAAQGCGWFDSSHTLRQGLAVTEWSDAHLAEGLLAWHAARWTGPCAAAQAARLQPVA